MVTVIEDAFSREGMLNMVFTTAIEGGINYWADVMRKRWSDRTEELNMIEEFYADIEDVEDDNKKYHIDADVIKRGIRKAFKNRAKIGDPYQRQAINDLYWGILSNRQESREEADFDADTADIIVQYGLFGELVYG